MTPLPRYKSGQTVLVAASRMGGIPPGRYKIINSMPASRGGFAYRVKGEREACERVVEERLMQLQEF